MVTYVQNELIKVTFIIDIGILGCNAHSMRPTRYTPVTHTQGTAHALSDKN